VTNAAASLPRSRHDRASVRHTTDFDSDHFGGVHGVYRDAVLVLTFS
jgi:hypothetical protein